MAYSTPCMCGAYDCPRCYPGCNEVPERDDFDDYEPDYDPSDKDNEWMDYIN